MMEVPVLPSIFIRPLILLMHLQLQLQLHPVLQPQFPPPTHRYVRRQGLWSRNLAPIPLPMYLCLLLLALRRYAWSGLIT